MGRRTRASPAPRADGNLKWKSMLGEDLRVSLEVELYQYHDRQAQCPLQQPIGSPGTVLDSLNQQAFYIGAEAFNPAPFLKPEVNIPTR
jgi:hypothetical protein